MHAIKPVYDRKTRGYSIDHRTFEPGDVIACLNSGYYVTDDLGRLRFSITAGTCGWYNGLSSPKKAAVLLWLSDEVNA
jgi:hypothetical protein